MLKKIYKINGIIYLSNENNSEIRYNYILTKNYNRYKDNYCLPLINDICKRNIHESNKD